MPSTTSRPHNLLPCVVLLGRTKSNQTGTVAHGYVLDVPLNDLECVRDRGLYCCVRSRMGLASRLFCSACRCEWCWLRCARLRSILLAAPTTVCLHEDMWSLKPRLSLLSDVLMCRAARVRPLWRPSRPPVRTTMCAYMCIFCVV